MNNTYYEKYFKYKNKYMDIKKDKYLTDDIKSIIEGIYTNSYNLPFDNNILRKFIKYNLDCDIRNDLNTDDQSKFMTYNKKNNLKFGCFKSMPNDDNYIFKKSLNKMTDIFVNILGYKLFEVFSLQIIDIMNEMVNFYISIHNKYNIYQLNSDDIIFLYKGGNIIRIYTEQLFGSMNSTLDKCTSINDLNNLIKNFDEIKSKQKFGDWDMTIHINSHLDGNIYSKIENDLNKILVIILENLKNNFSDLLFNKFSYKFLDFLNKVHHDYFEDPEFINFIKNFDRSMIISKIQTFDFSISDKGICKSENVELDKNSFITFDRPGTPIKDLVEFKYKLSDQADNNELNKIFVTQSTPHVVIRKFNIPFTISRLKVSNICSLTKNNEVINVSMPFELIDAVVFNQFDSQSHYIHSKLEIDNKPIYMLADYFGKKIRLPSIYYVYYDLEAILLRQNIFVWEDKKYGKRLLRLIIIALHASISDNANNKEIINNINIILDLFNNAKKIKYNSKINMFNDKYIILENKIILNKQYNIKYFGELLEHYIHCLICIDAIINKNMNNNYIKQVFEPNINYKPIPGSLYLTQPMEYYYSISRNNYYDKLLEFENEIIKYLQIISQILSIMSDKQIKLDNIITKI